MLTRVGPLLGALGASAMLGLLLPAEAGAWTRGTGPRGGEYAAGPRGAVAEGPRGGVAAAGPRGAPAVGPYGGAAAVARPRYAAGTVYRPPVAAVRPVPVYPGYAHPVAPLGGAVAAGVVAGATAGVVAGPMATP